MSINILLGSVIQNYGLKFHGMVQNSGPKSNDPWPVFSGPKLHGPVRGPNFACLLFLTVRDGPVRYLPDVTTLINLCRIENEK